MEIIDLLNCFTKWILIKFLGSTKFYKNKKSGGYLHILDTNI